MFQSPKDRLIIALDVNSLSAAKTIIQETRDFCATYKVGLELFSACGPAAIDLVQKANAHVFLDLKLHDIPNTIASAVLEAIQKKVDYLTIHTLGGLHMLKAAYEVVSLLPNQLQLLAVSVLTHHDDADLRSMGFKQTTTELALDLLQNAYQIGIRGFVCSALEAASIRQKFGSNITIVCPGIRPKGEENNDQTRVTTPALAIQNGADYLVVGRPITKASDMKKAASMIVREIQEGLHV